MHRWLPLIFLGISLLCGCRNPADSPGIRSKYRTFTSVLKKEEFGSFGFVSRLRGLQFSEGNLYASDFENGRILRLSPELKVLNQIGNPGTGPGEFQGAGLFHVNDGLIFAQNENPQQLYFFDNAGGLERTLSLPGLVIHTRFFFQDGSLFISTPSQPTPISVYDMDGEILRGFGTSFESDNARHKRARSYRHLNPITLDGQQFMVAVWETEPVIELFDMDGTLIVRQQFDNHAALVPRLAFRDAAYKDAANRGSSYILFQDVEVYDGRVYALPYSGKPYNEIAVFKLSTSGIIAEEIIRIPARIDRFTIWEKDAVFVSNWENREIHLFRPEPNRNP